MRGRAALLVIDVQNGTLSANDKSARPVFYDMATTRAVPNIARLLTAFRAAGLEVIYTVIEALTEDGRDLSLD